MKRRISCFALALPRFVAVLLLAVFGSSSAVFADTNDHGRTVFSVMTQNLSMGTDFQELLAAQTPAEFFQAVTTTYQNVLARKPAERMAAIAREIAKLKPDLVGLQEAAVLRTGSAPIATTVEFDLLQILLSELNKLGQGYTAVAVLTGLDAQAPSTLGFLVRFTVQDVILARTDRPGSELTLSNVQTRNYQAQITLPSAIGPLTNPAGWASVDVQIRDRKFRFVTTHLALAPNFDPTVPFAQATELIATAGNTELPVVFVGDFNSTANDPKNPTFATYRSFIDAGLVDTWLETHHHDPGFTCCQTPDLSNDHSLLGFRIDLVLIGGGVGLAAELVGDKQGERTPSGLWPSDHAGVFARLLVPQFKEPEPH